MSAALKIEGAIEFTQITCTCGGVYALPETFREMKQRRCESWHCPYCQVGWGFTHLKKEEDDAKRLADEKARHAVTLARANELEAEQKRLAARSRAGVCTCCNRTFKHLAAHMKTKHPEHGA